LGLVLFNVVANITSVSLSVKRRREKRRRRLSAKKGRPMMRSQTRKKPNIYLIVLDEYARTDMMKQQYGFDNTASTPI
jgi:hypothetical protein